jgi:transcription elongation factor Elf1
LRAQGPCPNCGKETQQYFGDILTIKGSRTSNTVECSNCKAKIEINAMSRTVRP